MAHAIATAPTAYFHLTDRLNRFPQGAPPSPLLFRILALLFSEREAALVAQLPIRPFTAAQAARLWKLPLAETRRTLEQLAARALLLDLTRDDRTTYVLPPPMAGFFEFSLMRVRQDLDQALLSELFYQYLNVEEDFVRELFLAGRTRPGRVLVHEPALPAGDEALQVLDYERASEVIRAAAHRAVSLCYCRHKMAHLGRACAAPPEICLTFNGTAASLARHGHARLVDVKEGLDLLAQAHAAGLVQFAENVQRQVSFLCNCCGCCCEALVAARRFGVLQPLQTTPFLPVVDAARCTGCGRCVDACPVAAMALVRAVDPQRPRARTARLDADRCLGCGLCVRACPAPALRLTARGRRRLTPVDTVHRLVLMAVERGRLQHLIFDNQAHRSHRAMAAVLGAVLRLPPVQRALAAEQLQSRYVAALLERWAGR